MNLSFVCTGSNDETDATVAVFLHNVKKNRFVQSRALPSLQMNRPLTGMSPTEV